ncbi:MAG: 16S rRNA (cytidine(1402)-2'-O)-methyltransferase [Proteobacteria bacterium]|nr:16S rRNA (cytidine(1402)-2'-O)-methyltransferase [Pseudomonadota bacterium]
MTSKFTLLGLAAEAERLSPGLHIVATPIGNLGDITLRALSTLAAADAILAEDKRVTRVLLAHYGITTPSLSYHEHNAEEMLPKILSRLAAGEALALVSDAGTPLVSDPGYRLVEAAIGAGHAITALPGASSVLAALVLAGLPSDRFFFEGFLPAKSGERRRRVRELATIPATLVFFEAPHRVVETLADLAAVLGTREAALARELTKKFETIRRGTLPVLAAQFAAEGAPKGEIVLVVGPPGAAEEAGDDLIDSALETALRTHSARDAVEIVAAELGLKRKLVYARSLQLSGKADRDA